MLDHDKFEGRRIVVNAPDVDLNDNDESDDEYGEEIVDEQKQKEIDEKNDFQTDQPDL